MIEIKILFLLKHATAATLVFPLTFKKIENIKMATISQAIKQHIIKSRLINNGLKEIEWFKMNLNNYFYDKTMRHHNKISGNRIFIRL
ncbi:hypothetical protein SAMN02583745_02797 [Thorsellia anophelis DSM 18579]|uniref:Uncharacterized protein n=1 Tax=Thorsellia anophelis DSM 18579 TaxID=1123402 RepID=A0A1I0FJW8_9GAMM|nr:hypothetical protein SAMN02583745_02797 [Thorsellia anophelis DSM 18579]